MSNGCAIYKGCELTGNRRVGLVAVFATEDYAREWWQEQHKQKPFFGVEQSYFWYLCQVNIGSSMEEWPPEEVRTQEIGGTIKRGMCCPEKIVVPLIRLDFPRGHRLANKPRTHPKEATV